MAGRFRLGRELGAGGMGTVHEALDLVLGRPVAIKVLRAGLAADEHQIARFEREALAAARLAHPNVVGVTELVRDPVLGLGLVMELLVGEPLHARLRRGPLAPAEAKSIFLQALDGLAAAHAAGMVHRDLKPPNVFLVPLAGGVLVKLLDFGIVKLAEEGVLPKLTAKGAVLGTPAYMSPEQVACEPVDARSDVYSIGACLYEALAGRPPYEAAHALHLIALVGAGPPPDLRELDARISPDVAHIVRTAMSRDPGGRYQTAAAMREALRTATFEAAPPARAPGVRRGWLALLVVAVLAAVATALALGGPALGGPALGEAAPTPSSSARPIAETDPEAETDEAPAPPPPEGLPVGIDPPEPTRRPRRARPTSPGTGAPTERTPRPVGEGILSPFAE